MHSVLKGKAVTLSVSKLSLCLVIVLGGCAQHSPLLTLPTAADPARSERVSPADDAERQIGASETRERFHSIALPTSSPIQEPVRQPNPKLPVFKSQEHLTLNIDSMAVPAFINEVFGNMLGLSLDMSPDLRGLANLVTLRVNKPEAPEHVYAISRDILARYGVEVQFDGELVRFQPGRGKVSAEIPLVVSGTTLPNVPVSHRDVFLVYALATVSVDDAARWMGDVFDGQPVKFERDTTRAALWIKGRPHLVEQAAKILASLDRPNMRGRNSLRIEPLFTEADKLAKSLTDVLKAEGYSVSGAESAAVVLLPMREIGSILVFANDAKAIDHVKSWVEQLDRPSIRAEGEGLFRYAVRNTTAKSILDVLQPLLGAGATAGSDSGKGEDSRSSVAPAPNSVKSPSTSKATTGLSTGGGQLVIDEARNALLFKGVPDAWQQLLPIVRQMDIPPKQVLVEVLVAEVQLSDSYSFGIEWAINNAALGADLFSKPATGSGSVVRDIGKGARIGAAGLSYYPISSSGQTRAVLNLLAEDKNVVIHQAPRLMVRSGESASINVGTQIPVLTSQSNVPGQTQGGTSALVQQIQYLNTGVNLSVKPVIYEGGRVDLSINQSLSESTSTNTLTPTVLNRAVTTALSVNDGGSVLIGGLISNNRSGGETKVPILGDIPLIGEFFKSTSKKGSRTELLVLIVPYVLDDGAAAERATEAFREKLELMVEGLPKKTDNGGAVER